MLDKEEDVARGEDRREVMRAAGPLETDEGGHGEVEDAAVEEDGCAEGLVLGGGGEVAFDGEIVEESGGRR